MSSSHKHVGKKNKKQKLFKYMQTHSHMSAQTHATTTVVPHLCFSNTLTTTSWFLNLELAYFISPHPTFLLIIIQYYKDQSSKRENGTEVKERALVLKAKCHYRKYPTQKKIIDFMLIWGVSR